MSDPHCHESFLARDEVGHWADSQQSVTQVRRDLMAHWPTLHWARPYSDNRSLALELPKGCQKCLHKGCHPTPRTRFSCPMASARTDIDFLFFKNRNEHAGRVQWADDFSLHAPRETPPGNQVLVGFVPYLMVGVSKAMRHAVHVPPVPPVRPFRPDRHSPSVAPPPARRCPTPGRRATQPHHAPQTTTPDHREGTPHA